MSESAANVILRTSPHFRSHNRVDTIMRNVVYALLPVCAFSVYQFGISVLALLITCTATCLLTEHFVCKLSGKPSTTNDWSVAITGLLLGLILPPGFPLWMAAVAAIFGVGIGKMFFGGLGFNIMNPALVGRAFAQAAFTVPATTWTPFMAENRFTDFIPSTLTMPFMKPVPVADWIASVSPDGWTGATPLALMKFDQISTEPVRLMLGTTAGSAGETSALLILICGLYLVARRMMDWRITFSVLLTAGATSGIFYMINPAVYPDPIFTIFSGGLMLGAVFMATDMVSSPVTPLGIWIYGALIGFITVIIRLFGGLNEGVMYAILLANACSPLISSFTQPRIYGALAKKGAA
ncbi:RnfABCDGE type electron transport complex subunit D [Puniceicoccales bacterium CK1056]|uniref:Ion-translocating oxidoreductase complex subunit D n=1 Tax=Oceanipulchritudo coccoides TaxID=2706888 RepID=A0A6B2M1A0_9BACT|nr:RnfABCDGE type electron transport complex subunit D [Oceanipulchritudo coccoides]NDV62146.1 RnfABCDGE type electron transport complex subunit D [Oceanipulchritudo coccoides]